MRIVLLAVIVVNTVVLTVFYRVREVQLKYRLTRIERDAGAEARAARELSLLLQQKASKESVESRAPSFDADPRER